MRSGVRQFFAACGLISLISVVLALAFASSQYADYAYAGYEDASWGRSLKVALVHWLPWIPLSPLVVVLGRLIPVDRRIWPLAVIVHLVLATAIAIGKGFVEVPLLQRLYAGGGAGFGAGHLAASAVSYWAFLGVVYALDYRRRWRERELRASQLESSLARARLEVLKSQLDPHFLFNTLHAISTLMHRDVEVADRMMSRLSDLLRLSLDRRSAETVPLRDELEFLDKYLEIQQIRFGDRLTVARRVDGALLEARLPGLILQPLVENAIRHGIARRATGGHLNIGAAREGPWLVIEIVDDGPGLPAPESGERGDGIGLGNTAERLRRLYGDRHRFELTGAEDGGCRVRLAVPFETGPDGERDPEARS